MKEQLENIREEVTTGAQGVTSGQKGPKRAKRGKKAYLDHIIDQKRLIKACRLKLSKIKLENESTTQVKPGKSPYRGSRGHKWPERVKNGHKGQKRPFWTILLIKNG